MVLFTKGEQKLREPNIGRYENILSIFLYLHLHFWRLCQKKKKKKYAPLKSLLPSVLPRVD
jgi:hypothetical protein